jgi:drug/metabolite transporter (DMT)-like permease
MRPITRHIPCILTARCKNRSYCYEDDCVAPLLAARDRTTIVTNQPDQVESQPPAKHAFLPELALLTTVTFWATTFIVTKDAFDYLDVMAFVCIRFLLMSLMAFAILAAVRARNPETVIIPKRNDLPRFLCAGIAGFTIYQLGYNLGLDRTSVFSASLLISTSPLFTILVLTAIGERPPAAAWIGVIVAVAGVAIFLRDQQGGEHSLSGDLLCFMAAAAFGLYNVINRPLAAGYPATTYIAWTLLFGSIPLVLAGLPAASRESWTSLGTGGWLSIAYVVVFPVYIAYMLWNFGIARRGAAIATSFGLLVPILAGTLSAILYDESFGPRKLIGAALVLGGLLFIRLGPRWLGARRTANAAGTAG